MAVDEVGSVSLGWYEHLCGLGQAADEVKRLTLGPGISGEIRRCRFDDKTRTLKHLYPTLPAERGKSLTDPVVHVRQRFAVSTNFIALLEDDDAPSVIKGSY